MVNYLNELYHLQKCPNCNEKMSFWKKKAGNKTPVCLSDKMWNQFYNPTAKILLR